jgi:hypothetical protein
MIHRIFHGFVAAVFAVAFWVTGGGNNAGAQTPIQQCASGCYTVDLAQLTGPFPNCNLCIETVWVNGTIWSAPQPRCYIPGDSVMECPLVPPGTGLSNVIVCGTALPGITGQYDVQCPGCPQPLCVVLCLDANGCLFIKVYPGPCPPPSTPLPCP